MFGFKNPFNKADREKEEKKVQKEKEEKYVHDEMQHHLHVCINNLKRLESYDNEPVKYLNKIHSNITRKRINMQNETGEFDIIKEYHEVVNPLTDIENLVKKHEIPVEEVVSAFQAFEIASHASAEEYLSYSNEVSNHLTTKYETESKDSSVKVGSAISTNPLD